MYPTICKIGPITIQSYGVMVAVAIIVCGFLMSRDAKKLSIKSDVIFDLIFWVVVGGIFGARIFYVLMNLGAYIMSPIEIIKIQNGGIAWQGGLIAGAIAGLLFVKKHKLDLLLMLDMSAPYLALGQSIGRIGCFLYGCCFGRPVTWGIYFPVHGDYLHPTQLYSTFGLLLIFFVLKTIQKKTAVKGQVFVYYLMLAAMLRFVIEFLRADHTAFIFGLSIFQMICLLTFSAAIVINSKLKTKSF